MKKIVFVLFLTSHLFAIEKSEMNDVIKATGYLIDNVNNLNERQKKLERDSEEKNLKINRLQNKLKELKNENDKINNEIVMLKNENTILKNDIDLIKNELNTIKQSILKKSKNNSVSKKN